MDFSFCSSPSSTSACAASHLQLLAIPKTLVGLTEQACKQLHYGRKHYLRAPYLSSHTDFPSLPYPTFQCKSPSPASDCTEFSCPEPCFTCQHIFLSRSSAVWKSSIFPSARTSRWRQGKMREDANPPLRFSRIHITKLNKALGFISEVFFSTPWKYFAAHRTSARP